MPVSQSRRLQDPCCYVRRRRMRLSKNKRTKTSLQRKGKKQSKLIKLHNLRAQPTPALDLGPHVACLRHQRPLACARMWPGFEVCVCVHLVCALSVLLRPAAKGQNICWMRSGWVREEGLGWGIIAPVFEWQMKDYLQKLVWYSDINLSVLHNDVN